jgi:hypothetical protein
MLRQYHSELGEKRIYEVSARFNPFIKKWAVRTKEDLKGQGIKFFGKEEKGNRNIYYCTQKAFDKLCTKIDIDQELLFD